MIMILTLFSWFFFHTHFALLWRHNELDGVSNHQPHNCLLNHLFRRRLNKTSKLRITGLCEGNSPVTAQRASNVENASVWWRHHELQRFGSSLWAPNWTCIEDLLKFQPLKVYIRMPNTVNVYCQWKSYVKHVPGLFLHGLALAIMKVVCR